jgi:hypothetical protein
MPRTHRGSRIESAVVSGYHVLDKGYLPREMLQLGPKIPAYRSLLLLEPQRGTLIPSAHDLNLYPNKSKVRYGVCPHSTSEAIPSSVLRKACGGAFGYGLGKELGPGPAMAPGSGIVAYVNKLNPMPGFWQHDHEPCS